MLVPYEKISALNFLVPFFVTILAVLFLKENIRIYRISALVIGFIGMLINFTVAALVATFFSKPPQEVSELVEKIREP